MGLFGKSKFKKAFEPFEVPGTPGIGDGIAAETKPASFWQGGEKFGVKDGIAGILAVLGDAFTQRGGGQSNAVQSLAGSRLSAMEMAKQQAQQEQVYKQLIAAGVDPAKAGLVVSGAAKYGDVAPGTTKADRVQDNAGNYWTKGADGKWALDFVDNTERTFFNNGMQITVPNRYSGANVGTQAPGYQPQVNVGGEMLTPPRLGGGIPTVRTEQDYYALPAGTQYMDPNGILKRKGNR